MQTSVNAAPNGKSAIPSTAELAAELASLNTSAAEVAPTEPAAEAAAAEPEAEAEPAAPEAEAEPAKAAPDPTDQALAAKHRQEEQFRKRMAAERKAAAEERAKVEAEKRAFEEQRASLAEQAKRWEALKSKGLRGLIEAAEEMGIEGEDFEQLARAFYVRSPAAKADPKARAAVDEAVRSREHAGRTQTLEQKYEELAKKYEALEKRDLERETMAKTERDLGSYLDSLARVADTGKVTDYDDDGNEVEVAKVEAPIVKRWLKSEPAAARRALHEIAVEIAQRDELDEAPPLDAVVAELEKRERRALARRYGAGAPTALLGAAPAKPAGPGPAKTLSRTGAAPAAAKPKLTGDALLDDIKRAVESGKFDD